MTGEGRGESGRAGWFGMHPASGRARWGGALLAMVLAALAAAGCGAQREAPPQAARPPVTAASQPAGAGRLFDYRQAVLANGLRVITLEDFSCPIVAVHITYHVGSKDERPDRQGFAHMVEHMMFYATERLGPEAFTRVVRGSGGDLNGYTNFDRTAYFETVPACQLPLALWLEAERMAFLQVDQASFSTERKVVEEERRMGLAQPYGSVLEKMLPEMFRVHPYRWERIGSIAHLRASSAAEVREFWNRYYVPANATLVLVGAVKHEEALAQAKRAFGWIPRYPPPPPVALVEPPPDPARPARTVVLNEKNAPAPMLLAFFRTLPAGHPDAPAVDMLGRILAGGDDSRLHRELVMEKELAAEVEYCIEPRQQDGLLEVYVTLMAEAKEDEAFEALRRHVDRLRTEKVTERELAKVRNQMLKEAVLDTLTAERRADVLADAAVIAGDVEHANGILQRLRTVTDADLLRVAQSCLAPCRTVYARVPASQAGAKNNDLAAEEAAPVRLPATQEGAVVAGRPGCRRPADCPDQPPMAPAQPPQADLRCRETTLPNGLRLLVVRDARAPYVSLALNFRHGDESARRPGAARLAMEMLTDGTDERTEEELAEELATYAIDMAGSSGIDSSSLEADCLSEHLERAMGLLAECATSPSFEREAFEARRNRVRTDLEMDEATPSSMANRELALRLWGEHPYARAAGLRAADLDALRLREVRAWFARHVRPEEATLIVCGDVTEERAAELAARFFGPWKKAPARPVPASPAPPPAAATRIYLIDQPDLEQSEIRIGQLGITQHHPEYPVAVLVNSYFGGDLDSRLYQKLRAEKGLTYGVSGQYSARREGGTFQVSTFTKTASTAQALREAMGEIRRLIAQPPTAQELQINRAYLLGSFAASRETAEARGDDVWMLRNMNLGDDFFRTYLDRIARASADDCGKLIRQTLDPDKMVIVVVADAARTKAELETIAPVTVVPPAPPAGKAAAAPAGK